MKTHKSSGSVMKTLEKDTGKNSRECEKRDRDGANAFVRREGGKFLFFPLLFPIFYGILRILGRAPEVPKAP